MVDVCLDCGNDHDFTPDAHGDLRCDECGALAVAISHSLHTAWINDLMGRPEPLIRDDSTD
jgi:hypothetical protein